jgi:hypothetical protein
MFDVGVLGSGLVMAELQPTRLEITPAFFPHPVRPDEADQFRRDRGGAMPGNVLRQFSSEPRRPAASQEQGSRKAADR